MGEFEANVKRFGGH